MWTLVLIEDINENFPDIIPKSWIINEHSTWYPSNFRLSTINSLAKTKAFPVKTEWSTCTILKVIKNDIDDYEKGLRLMYKVSKNGVKANLSSENETKGRGFRIKQSKKWIESDDDIDNDANYDEPVILPKSKAKKSLSFTEVNNQSYTEVNSFPSYPDQSFTDHDNDCSLTTTNVPSPTINFSPITVNQEHSFKSNTPSRTKLNSTDPVKCKLSKKKIHNCSFGDNSNMENLVYAQGHQLCSISADIQKMKNSIYHIKHLLDAFVEESRLGGNRQPTVNTSNQYDSKLIFGSSFPLKTIKDLKYVEDKLRTDDDDYSNKLMASFSFAAEGKTINKITNNLLKTVFSDNLAALYSWKGQKTKEKLEDLQLCILIIGVVRQKAIDCAIDIKNCKTLVISSIMTWFAQAPSRIQRASNNNKSQEKLELRHDTVVQSEDTCAAA